MKMLTATFKISDGETVTATLRRLFGIRAVWYKFADGSMKKVTRSLTLQEARDYMNDLRVVDKNMTPVYRQRVERTAH